MLTKHIIIVKQQYSKHAKLVYPETNLLYIMFAMKILYSSLAIVCLILIPSIGTGYFKFYTAFGIIVPCIAFIIFLAGFIYKIISWALSPVPFCIPTVCGQQKSLPWIKADNIQSPSTTWGLIRRMALEILLFSSLFRNDKAVFTETKKLTYDSNKVLWFGGLVFHWAFLVIILRHLRLFIEPVPSTILFLQGMDGMFKMGLPTFYVTDILIFISLTFLILRRAIFPQIRFISLFSDYFALFLLLGIVISGFLMRHFYKVDIMAVKMTIMGILTFKPLMIEGLGIMFYVHMFLVCIFLSYFPFSKLMHMGGIFLSPTRNLKNDSRTKRHINPWDYPVKVHTYEEWESEFRGALKEAGLPVEKKR